MVEDRFLQALEEAKNVDSFLAQNKFTTEELAVKKPLLGVPVTIKESCAVKGKRHILKVKSRFNILNTEKKIVVIITKTLL